MQMRAVIFAHTARVKEKDGFQIWKFVLNIKDFIYLFLILSKHKLGFAMFQNIGDFICYRILIDGDWNSANFLCRKHSPVKMRTIPPNNGNIVICFDTNGQQAKGKVAYFRASFCPCPALPDTIFFFTICRLVTKIFNIIGQ